MTLTAFRRIIIPAIRSHAPAHRGLSRLSNENAGAAPGSSLPRGPTRQYPRRDNDTSKALKAGGLKPDADQSDAS